jgi:hypothetical protein
MYAGSELRGEIMTLEPQGQAFSDETFEQFRYAAQHVVDTGGIRILPTSSTANQNSTTQRMRTCGRRPPSQQTTYKQRGHWLLKYLTLARSSTSRKTNQSANPLFEALLSRLTHGRSRSNTTTLSTTDG